jgi:hypothetical protein
VALAFALAALCPAGQLAASLHEGMVRHVICADHGELTHVTSTAAAPSSSTAPDAPGIEADTSSSEHEHCPQVGMLSRARPQPVRTVSAAPEVLARALGEPARYVAPGTRLLLCAPKTSPPTA